MTPPRTEELMYPDIVNNAQVNHPTFGVGKVILRTGMDEFSKAIIKFKEEGEKKVSLKYAGLWVDKVEEEDVEGFDEEAADSDKE